MFRSILAVTLAALPFTFAIPTVTAVGSKFFTSDGNQWFIKGVAYQLTEKDPLIDTNQCTMDANLMQTLGTNAIRVYHVDATANHDGCMQAFSNAGIYTFIDLDTFNTYILGNEPSWNQTQFDSYGAVMDTFAKYDNVAGFFVGNEVITVATQGAAAAYIKAAARDMKAYRNSKGYRQIPVGYSAADIAELRPMLQNYLACGGNASESIDFFSLNSYEWCGNTNYMASGYANLQNMSANYPVPIFFSETGCITARGISPRDFADQAAIFGPQMVDTWSGSIIYEWIQEQNDYGIISYGGSKDNPLRSGTPTPISPDFNNLKSAWTIQPSGVKASDYASTVKLTTPACPSSTAGASGWPINGNPSIPAIGQQFVATGSSLPSATGSSTLSVPTGTSGSANPSSTGKSAASGGKEIAGMTVGLGVVMVGVMLWL